jgi:hypothetical protein
VLEHKQELFLWLRQKWADLFLADCEVLLDDLTSIYFEGATEENPKPTTVTPAINGRVVCGRCALVITPDGFPFLTSNLASKVRRRPPRRSPTPKPRFASFPYGRRNNNVVGWHKRVHRNMRPSEGGKIKQYRLSLRNLCEPHFDFANRRIPDRFHLSKLQDGWRHLHAGR